eukprot:TRINITY_DN14506_c0_g1_i1.p1 TRINITY_DN14506_c0_g1~~TRINITY_DN14506_c0_g1_i1.p1  ORF type:complete len:1230 (+),score=329.71 TRINITY_DN14506_c0_g1_i1:106-3795(+)
MGRIERIEVENFKSYAGHQIIGPFKDFTAVIGPNGAGKSNLMDALSFVLGVRTTELRGHHLRELIYRSGDDVGQKLKCFVMLVFKAEDDVEIHFTRSILHQGQSEYRLNGKPVSQEDYNNKLISIGILVKARNFLVFQGDVENIAAKDAKELSAMFEEISGSGELKQRYEELKAARDKAEDNTVFNFTKKKTMAAEKKQFMEQKEEAENYIEMQDKQRQLLRDYMLWQLKQFGDDLRKSEKDLAGKNEELAKMQKKQKAIDDEVGAKRKEAAKYTREMEAVTKKIEAKKHDVEKVRPQTVALQEKITHSKRKIDSTQSKIDKARAEYENVKKERKRLESDLKDVQKAQKEFEKSKKAEAEGLKISKAQLDEYHSLKNLAGVRATEERSKLEQLQRQRGQIEQSLRALETKAKDISARIAQLDEQEAMHKATEARSQLQIDQFMKQLAEATSKREDLTEQQRQSSARVQELTNIQNDAVEKLKSAKFDIRSVQAGERVSECIAEMKRQFPGVYGRVSDLCKPSQKKYDMAVAVALGRNMDAVVVDTMKTAKECVDHLKLQRMRPMTFLPLDTIKVKRINEKLRSFGESAKLVLDLLTYEVASIERALQYCVGNTLCCPTLAEARRFAYGERDGDRHKVVTLDGTLINKSGSMTGGSSAQVSAARRWDEKAIQTLKQKRDSCKQELAKLGTGKQLDADIALLNVDISVLNGKLTHHRTHARNIAEKIAKLSKERDMLQKERAKDEPQIAKLAAQLDSADAEIAVVAGRIDQIEVEVFREFSKAVKVANIREYEDSRLQQAKEFASKSSEFAEHIAKLQNSIEFSKSRDFDDLISKKEQELKADQEELAKFKADQKKQEELMNKLTEEVEGFQKEHDRVKQKVDDLEVTIKELKKQLAKIGKEMTVLHKAVTTIQSAEEQMKSKRLDIYQKCRVEEIDLSSGGSGAPAGGRRGRKAQDDMDDGSQSLSQAAATMEVDFTGLDSRLKALNPSKGEITADVFEQELARYSEQLARSAPNMKAVDRFNDVQSRLKQTAGVLEEAKNQSRLASEDFNSIKKERYDRFMKAYNLVTSLIDTVYKKLTKDDEHPGGQAYLTLEDSEEPYLHGVKYYAMPPRKRFRDMEQLSGGEKTVAALALLFAVHSVQPAPFFVLDEVDAALDNVNVNRVARYISETSSNQFQFVVISLKDMFYAKANGLIGIYRDQEAKCSRTLTLSLDQYEEAGEAEEGSPDAE